MGSLPPATMQQSATRQKFAVLLPSTNTMVEYEFNRLLVPGVSFHTGRIYIPNPDLSSSETMVAFLSAMRLEIEAAVTSVLTAQPTYIVMGMSAETFWGGKSGADEFETWIRRLAGGMGVTTGAAACKAVLDVYDAKRIAVITPYQPVGDEQVVGFFTQMGYEVVRIKGLKCDSATSIADVTKEELKDAFRQVNGDGVGVDLLIQAGTNLCAGQAAREMEIELGKPVVAINVATVWHAYRSNGILDKVYGWGSLLEEH